MSDPSLEDLGWTPQRASAFTPHQAAGLVAGRVVSSGGVMIAATAAGSTQVILQRRFRRSVTDRTQLPTVGDWLALAPVRGSRAQGVLHEVLPRAGRFIRNRLSDGKPQILAANVDVAFIVSGLDHDLNLRRIERYLVLAREGDVAAVVVLNKADIVTDLEAAMREIETVAAGTPVLATSAATGSGLEQLRARISPGTTACLLGSSGVGKSTITNALLGEQRQVVKALREDDSRGRHTTSHRELFLLDGGGCLIDTPGLRTVGVLGDAESIEASFADIESLALQCRFADCKHDEEPGCAVRDAIDAGTLSAARLASHETLEAERHAVEVRSDARAKRAASRQLGRVYRQAGKDAIRDKRGGQRS